MKTGKILFMSWCCWCLGTSHAAPLETVPAPASALFAFSNENSVNDVIRSSFRAGSARNLAEHFNEQLELFIDTEAVDFPEVRAKHAELILSTFFKKHPPQNFQFVYQGGSASLHYITGLYQTGGQRFSVYMLIRPDTHHRLLINTLHLRKG